MSSSVIMARTLIWRTIVAIIRGGNSWGAAFAASTIGAITLHSLHTHRITFGAAARHRVAQALLTRFSQWQRHGPESVAADTTYRNGEFLQWLADQTITPYMRTRASAKRKNSVIDRQVGLA